MEKWIERFGRLTGETIGTSFLESQRRKIERFNLKMVGQNNLQSLSDVPFILVANHLMPLGSFAQQSQLSPDAFVLETLVRNINNQNLKIVSKCDDGWWAKNFVHRYFQRKAQPFGRAMQEGMGLVPIYRNPGTFNRGFIAMVDYVIQNERNPILIFPEGNWYEDFSSDHPLEPGAAHIAKKYKLPVLPVYINGARSWKPNTSVWVAFGKPFNSERLSKKQVTEKIRSTLTKLQEEMPRN